MIFHTCAVIREGSLQADPGLEGLRGGLGERLREYRAAHRQEERELAANTKALQDRTERRDTTLKRLNRLQVGTRCLHHFKIFVFIVLFSSVAVTDL